MWAICTGTLNMDEPIKYIIPLIRLKEKVWIGTIGKQSKEAPYGWEGFQLPTAIQTDVKQIMMNYEQFSGPTMHGADAIVSTDDNLKYHKDYCFKIQDLPNDGITLNLAIEVGEYSFFDTDYDRLMVIFIKEVKRILGGDWAGTNNNLESDALKDHLRSSGDLQFFLEKYPELLV